MSKKLKQTYFQDGWLSFEEFKAWLCKASTKGEARCRLCQTNIALSTVPKLAPLEPPNRGGPAQKGGP